jgi:hypothetical protein
MVTGVNVRVELSKAKHGEKIMFLFVHAKPFMSEYNKIYTCKGKRKIPILYCTANQL